MSISAEWIINLGPYEHVKLTLKADTVEDLRADMSRFNDARKEELGDYHASLKAAVLYGRDQALKGLAPNPNEPTPPAGGTEANDPETAHEGAVEALKGGLGATVLDMGEGPVEAPPSPSTSDVKPKRPWDKKHTRQGGVTRKPSEVAKSQSDWDF